MRDERRFDAGAWLTLAVSVGWLVVFIAFGLYVYQFPQDGWRYGSADGRFGAFVAEANLTGRPSVLQPGDRVVAIEGQGLIPEGAPPFPPDLRVGRTVRYTVERDGQTMELLVPLIQLRATTPLVNILDSLREEPRELIVSLVIVLVAGYAFFVRPGNLGARYLFLIFSYYFAVSWLGFTVSSLYQSTFPFLAQLATNVFGYSWFWFFFASLIQLPLAFPVVKAPLRRFPRLLPAVLYSFAILTTLVLGHLELTTASPLWTSMAFVCFGLYIALTVASIFGTLIHNWLTLRDPIARAQLRWMTLGMGLGLGGPFMLMLVIVVQRGTLSGAGADMLWLLILLPVCLAVAITRYRLFDIDVIIRRTLVYAVVTSLLALAFYGSVLVLQQLFRGATGAQSPVAIVASTLAIAALFSPLRRRVQDFVDRRFFRRKYDAQQVLAWFATVARDETDLDALTGELARVVRETMQPEDVSVWLNETGRESIGIG